ncbi:DUF1003 domain-containing protein [Mixta intestinalis]|uniref:Uncharacterized protein n=1 Tax=Mixta intestinalis TaxID=1615494 RepID=A0A6P1Q4I6_9GAMM|nr:DUF1003 domain-containing protein [Mixta intestinalis]QHM73990.1 hypothetical protein C7M51_04351 [Mixta intestinalis]
MSHTEQTENETKRKRGRPKSENRMSDAERARLYRLRKKTGENPRRKPTDTKSGSDFIEEIKHLHAKIDKLNEQLQEIKTALARKYDK